MYKLKDENCSKSVVGRKNSPHFLFVEDLHETFTFTLQEAKGRDDNLNIFAIFTSFKRRISFQFECFN